MALQAPEERHDTMIAIITKTAHRQACRWLTLACLTLVVVMVAPASAKDEKPIRIGSKASVENTILGEVLTHVARHAGATAEHKSALGGTQIAFRSLLEGDIDAYPEYTGTLTAEILADDKIRDEEGLHAALGRRGLLMTPSLGFANPYAIGLKDALADRLAITKISDLAKPEHADLRFAFSDEFMDRGDGWPGLAATYRLAQRPKTVDHALAYRGIESGAVDVTDLYATDAEVAAYQLRVLEDDRGYFPSYQCVIIYREDLQERAPAVVAAFEKLAGKIDDTKMREMNARAKLDHVRDARVAAEFVNESLGIDVPVPEDRLGILRSTRQHLFLVAVSLLAAVVVAVPLGVCSATWPKVGFAIMGIVGIIQTLPSMAVLVFMIPLLGIGPWPAIVALFLYSLLPIVRGTVTGLGEIPGTLIESATVLGLSPRARLWLIELPMASRSILAGIKTAAVINVGTATIGALIGAGGYGEPILTGLRLADLRLILQGAIPAAVLALLVQGGFDVLALFVVPKGLRLGKAKS